MGTGSIRRACGDDGMTQQRHIVIVGAGFGGLRAARALKHADVRITVIDRRNYHLFQPLLYEVATAGLSPNDIAYPIRAVLRRQKNSRVFLAEVVAIDTKRRKVVLQDGEEIGRASCRERGEDA